MVISNELRSAIRTVYAGFHGAPGDAWRAWLTVTDEVGQNATTLVGSLIERGIRGERQVPLRAYAAYTELANASAKQPWDELLEVSDDGKFIRLRPHVDDVALRELSAIIVEETTAVE